MRTMGDAVDPADIPLTVDIVGVYRNGLFAADPAKVAARFPAAKYVTVWIDVNGTCPHSAQVLDVEEGDAGPAQAPGWVKARRAVVHTSLPTLYCDRAVLPDVQRECAAAGLKSGRDYQLWPSTLDGSETDLRGRPLRDIPGVVAVQVEGGPAAAWDRSVVYYDNWHPLA
jgi:hypothetical protein